MCLHVFRSWSFLGRLWGALLLALATMSSGKAADDSGWLKPKPLRPGDTIMFVAPSGVVDRQLVDAAARRCEKLGFRVIADESLFRRHGYLAGTDQERAAELNRAFRDPHVRAIFPCRGGYGVTRILDKLDFDALRKDPKIIIGFSDITALHLAIAKTARVITFHSPMPQAYLWSESQEYHVSCERFWNMLGAEFYDLQTPPDMVTAHPGDSAAAGRQTKLTCLVPGRARGRLVGGNLSLICATLGTPYAIEAQGRLLFLEDVSEKPYRIDRMLCQLRLAGVLEAVSGVILGDFTDTDEAVADKILDEYFGCLQVPVIKGFPMGHASLNLTLPHGAMAELDATEAAPENRRVARGIRQRVSR